MAYTKALGTVLKHTKIAPKCFDITVKTPQALSCVQGQFMQIYCDGKTLRRPISICEFDAKNETIRMVYMVKGEGTAWLSRVKVGDTLDMLGPLGHGFQTAKKDNVIVVGGGIGVPPMLQTAKSCTGTVRAILGFRSKEAAILTEDFEKVCSDTLIATDDGTLGHHGFVTDILEEELKKGGCDLVAACGPTPMLKAVAGVCERYDVSCQVSLEERMGCGIGACVGCVCKVKQGENGYRHAQVCRYGPVIDAKEVVW